MTSVLSGTLFKRQKVKKGLVERYYTLTEQGELQERKRESDKRGAPSSIFTDLREIDALPASEGRFGFKLIHGRQSHTLYAETEESRARWIAAFQPYLKPLTARSLAYVRQESTTFNDNNAQNVEEESADEDIAATLADAAHTGLEFTPLENTFVLTRIVPSLSSSNGFLLGDEIVKVQGTSLQSLTTLDQLHHLLEQQVFPSSVLVHRANVSSLTFQDGPLGFRFQVRNGIVVITQVDEEGQAAELGMHVADVIIAVNGKPFDPPQSPAEFGDVVKSHPRPLAITTKRGFKVNALDSDAATLNEKEEDPVPANVEQPQQQPQQQPSQADLKQVDQNDKEVKVEENHKEPEQNHVEADHNGHHDHHEHDHHEHDHHEHDHHEHNHENDHDHTHHNGNCNHSPDQYLVGPGREAPENHNHESPRLDNNTSAHHPEHPEDTCHSSPSKTSEPNHDANTNHAIPHVENGSEYLMRESVDEDHPIPHVEFDEEKPRRPSVHSPVVAPAAVPSTPPASPLNEQVDVPVASLVKTVSTDTAKHLQQSPQSNPSVHTPPASPPTEQLTPTRRTSETLKSPERPEEQSHSNSESEPNVTETTPRDGEGQPPPSAAPPNDKPAEPARFNVVANDPIVIENPDQYVVYTFDIFDNNTKQVQIIQHRYKTFDTLRSDLSKVTDKVHKIPFPSKTVMRSQSLAQDVIQVRKQRLLEWLTAVVQIQEARESPAFRTFVEKFDIPEK